MQPLLPYWCMLGEVNQIGTYSLRISLHVNGLRKRRENQHLYRKVTD